MKNESRSENSNSRRIHVCTPVFYGHRRNANEAEQLNVLKSVIFKDVCLCIFIVAMRKVM